MAASSPSRRPTKPHTPLSPAVRRNLEITISRLNDLGIVVYDLSDGKLQ